MLELWKINHLSQINDTLFKNEELIAQTCESKIINSFLKYWGIISDIRGWNNSRLLSSLKNIFLNPSSKLINFHHLLFYVRKKEWIWLCSSIFFFILIPFLRVCGKSLKAEGKLRGIFLTIDLIESKKTAWQKIGWKVMLSPSWR